MPEFKPNVAVSGPDKLVEVTVSRANPMPPGKYVFQLIVEDDEGNFSAPSFVDVLIRDRGLPTAIVEVTDGNGGRIEKDVLAGQSFFLSGERSSDVDPGKVVGYSFTLVEAPL